MTKMAQPIRWRAPAHWMVTEIKKKGAVDEQRHLQHIRDLLARRVHGAPGACARASVHACERACYRACVRACCHACVLSCVLSCLRASVECMPHQDTHGADVDLCHVSEGCYLTAEHPYRRPTARWDWSASLSLTGFVNFLPFFCCCLFLTGLTSFD